jgi:hypothetical protein
MTGMKTDWWLVFGIFLMVLGHTLTIAGLVMLAVIYG